MNDPTAPPSATPGRSQPPSGQGELDRALISGLAWTGVSKWGAQLVTWATTLFVARLLTPEDYGLVGMAILFLGLVRMVTEFGISTAVVKLRDLTTSQLNQLNVLAMVLGAVGFVLTLLSAQALAIFFKAPDLPPVLMVTGTTFLLNSARSVPEALLRKDLRFRLLALIEAARAIATAIVALGLALLGFGYWALVFSNVAGVAFGAIAIIRYRRVFVAMPRVAEISEALKLSRDMVVARLAWYVYANADFLIVSKFLGQVVLGTYSLGWTLATIPVTKITAIVQKVTSPVFSAVQDDPVQIRRYLLWITEALAFIAFPLTIGLGLVAEEFVRVILNEQWLPAVGALRLLAWYATLRTIQPLLPQVLVHTGDSRLVMDISLVSAVVLPVGFYVGSGYGAEGVAWAWIFLDPLLNLPLLLRLRSRIRMPIRSYLGALRPALVACLSMSAAVLGVQVLVEPLSTVAQLFLQIATGALVYAAVVLGIFGDRVKALRHGIVAI